MVSAVLRVYDNAPGLVDAIEAHLEDVRGLLTGVTGFRAWNMIRTANGGFSLTVCDDKAGCDETVRLAADWIKQNVPNAGAIPAPTIIEGSGVARITPQETLTT
jgi:hypothetical protein